MRRGCALALAVISLPRLLCGQVCSPRVVLANQIDPTDLPALARGIYSAAGAVSPREKAEAIWRFFLTDGRFVTPGFWYHIAGWAYEEPQGEVLDPLKLLHSYGFGLCYHIAPLLEAVYEAGGFEDARVWFLTGHTVTEVYYGGSYHYFDSDMLGYNTVGEGDPKKLAVASVAQIVRDGSLILGKLRSPTEADRSKVDQPWYPADLREGAMGGLADLFTSAGDNWLYPYARYAQSHTMDFVLRPGERLIRYYQPESPGVYYLPYKYDGTAWSEFPQEVAQYGVRTEDGPRSQKDNRRWGTGRIEYRPVLSDRAAYYTTRNGGLDANLRFAGPGASSGHLGRAKTDRPAQAVFEIASPYVLIDAELSIQGYLADSRQFIDTDLSVDGGRTWEVMDRLPGPFRGTWRARPRAKQRSQHGVLTAVTGAYGYLVRLTLGGMGPADGLQIDNIEISSRFQHNPRTLPSLAQSRNVLRYEAGPQHRRRPLPIRVDQIRRFAAILSGAEPISEGGQVVLWPSDGGTGQAVFELSAPDNAPLSGIDAGARFLDLRDGLAPDKLTAETRVTKLGAKAAGGSRPRASLGWATSPAGPYQALWEYDENPVWRDGLPVRQALRWPEVDRRVRELPSGTTKVYVRYRFEGMGLDSPRMAVYSPAPLRSDAVEVTHVWFADGARREHTERIGQPWLGREYSVDTGRPDRIVNHALIISCPPAALRAGRGEWPVAVDQ